MNYVDFLQDTTSLEDVPEALSAYFRRNSEINTNLVGILGDFFGDSQNADNAGARIDNLHTAFIAVEPYGTNNAGVVKTSDLKLALKTFEDASEGEDLDPAIPVIKASNGDVIEEITLSQFSDRLGDLVDQINVAACGLDSLGRWFQDKSQDFYSVVINQTKSAVGGATRCLRTYEANIMGMISQYGDIGSQEIAGILSNFLSSIGIPVPGHATNELGTYTGTSPLTCLLTTIGVKVEWVAQNFANAVLALFTCVGAVVAKAAQVAWNKYCDFIEDAVLTVVDANSALVTSGILGKGTVSHPGFSYKLVDRNDGYTMYTDEAVRRFEATFDGVPNVKYTVPLGPMILYLVGQNHQYDISYDLKIIDSVKVDALWHKYFYTSIDLGCQYWQGVVVDAGLHLNSLSGVSKSDLQNFLAEIEGNKDYYYCRSGKDDASAYVDLVCARFIACCYMALAIDNGVDTNISSTVAADLAQFYKAIIQDEPNYKPSVLSLEPTNLELARITTVLANESGHLLCFNSLLPDSDHNCLDFSNLDYDFRYINGQPIAWFLDMFTIICRSNDNLSSGVFIPYYDKIKSYRPSYKIPTDQDNMSLARKMLYAGLIVATVVVGIVIASKVKRHLDYKRFVLENSAGALSWDCAASGNTTGMKAAYKMSRKASMLASLTGVAESGGASIVGTAVSAAAASFQKTADIGEITSDENSKIYKCITGSDPE